MDYLNDVGTQPSFWSSNGSWISQGVSAVGGIAAGYLSAKEQAKTNRDIASMDVRGKTEVAKSQLDAERYIQEHHDLTAIEIEKIRAMAAINAPQAPAKSNVVMIGIFGFLIVATVGIFYIGSMQPK